MLSGEGLEGLLRAYEALTGRALAKDVEDGRVVEGEFLNVMRGGSPGDGDARESHCSSGGNGRSGKQEEENTCMKKSV